LKFESDVLSSASSQGVPSAYDVLETAMDLTQDHNNTRCVALHENFHNFLRVCPEMLLLAMPQKLSRHVPFAVFRNKCQIISNTDVIIAETLHIQTAELIFRQNNNNKNETLNFQFNHAKIYKSN